MNNIGLKLLFYNFEFFWLKTFSHLMSPFPIVVAFLIMFLWLLFMIVNLLFSINVVTSSPRLIVPGQIVVMFANVKEKCFTILLLAKLGFLSLLFQK
jgi:hypothetical protein